MIILPAIDIKDGQCVRLFQGDFNTVTKVAEDAVETGLRFKEAGAKYIHMVDLDGAVNGEPKNFDLFVQVAKATGLPVEVGGGIRTMKIAQRYLSAGISRVILGSAALQNKNFVKEAVREFGAAVAVGIDAKNGFVSINGWLDTSTVNFIDFACLVEDLGASNLIYTDISTDGTLLGPNLAHLKQLKEAVSCDITASGGIRDLRHIRVLKEMGLYGAICGKSIYSNTLDLKEAIAVAEGE